MSRTAEEQKDGEIFMNESTYYFGRQNIAVTIKACDYKLCFR